MLKYILMIEGLIGLVAAAEVARAQVEAQKIADAFYANSEKYVVTYDISSRGKVRGDMNEFERLVGEILQDERGWRRAGVSFQQVESGGKMHVILAEPAEVEAAAPWVCSSKLSCSVGSLVLLNDDRWMGGSDSYNAIGVDILHYRQMVTNHEVGHFLGHRHIEACETEAGKAPIMLQQSTGLRGCEPNYWPLPSELWVSGI